jgi:hypothetical protein
MGELECRDVSVLQIITCVARSEARVGAYASRSPLHGTDGRGRTTASSCPTVRIETAGARRRDRRAVYPSLGHPPNCRRARSARGRRACGSFTARRAPGPPSAPRFAHRPSGPVRHRPSELRFAHRLSGSARHWLSGPGCRTTASSCPTVRIEIAGARRRDRRAVYPSLGHPPNCGLARSARGRRTCGSHTGRRAPGPPSAVGPGPPIGRRERRVWRTCQQQNFGGHADSKKRNDCRQWEEDTGGGLSTISGDFLA